MKKLTAYCMRDRKKVEIQKPKAIVHPNGKHAITGKCPICGGKVFRMGELSKFIKPSTDEEDEEEAAPVTKKSSKGKAKGKAKAKASSAIQVEEDDDEDE